MMTFSGFDNLDPGVRSFMLISVALAYPAWDFGFDVGVYGKLFFEKSLSGLERIFGAADRSDNAAQGKPEDSSRSLDCNVDSDHMVATRINKPGSSG